MKRLYKCLRCHATFPMPMAYPLTYTIRATSITKAQGAACFGPSEVLNSWSDLGISWKVKATQHTTVGRQPLVPLVVTFYKGDFAQVFHSKLDDAKESRNGLNITYRVPKP